MIKFSFLQIAKVPSLLEACFDLISGSSLHMKIQIMGGKITENLGFKSLLRKVKIFDENWRNQSLIPNQ